MSRITGLLLATVLAVSVISCSASKSKGFVFTTEPNTPAAEGNQGSNDQALSDKDLHSLISHNLGVLDHNEQLEESTKAAISQFGTKNLMSHQKLNFLFLVDSAQGNAVKPEKPSTLKKTIKHKSAEFSVCENASSSECILDLIFNPNNEQSLIKKLTTESPEDTEIYFYTGDANTGKTYSESLLSLQQLKNGELAMYEHKLDKSYKIKANLEQCINNALASEYTVNIEKRTITPLGKNQNQPKITFAQDKKEDFVAFMQDICSVVSIAKLIRRDTQPALFTFYLTSLNKMESILAGDQITVVQSIFNIAYYQFVNSVKKYYSDSEISGQILVLSHENTLGKMYENVPAVNAQAATSFVQLRNLQSTTNKVTYAQTTDVIYKSVLIGFVLISLWVWIEMFLMPYPKDSIVYAKFSTTDYLRR